jgi:hypothetical protein
MTSQRHLFLLITLLIVASLSIFLYKVVQLKWPLYQDQQAQLWIVEARLNFKAHGTAVSASLYTPPGQSNMSTLDENFISRNYGLNTKVEENNHIATWTKRHATGQESLYYRVSVFPATQNETAPKLKPPITVPQTTLEGLSKEAAASLLESVRAQSADSLSFVIEVVKRLHDDRDDNANILLANDRTPYEYAKTAMEIVKEAHIPTRLVNGIFLGNITTDRRDVPMSHLIAVWDGTDWQMVNPDNGNPGLPNDFMIWSYDDNAPFTIKGGDHAKLAISANSHMQSSLEISKTYAERQKSVLAKFSLFSLPLHTQQIYSVLIMIPLGAFVILMLRTVVGIRTFGTFMPVLVALAFRETQLVYGVALFTFVVALGLGARFYLEHLRLLHIPRIAVVLTVVVILMLFITMLSHQLGLSHGLSIALFPMVIIAMTIERMCIVWEERSPWEAIQHGTGSMFAASLAYLAMRQESLQHLLFVFPELLLLVIAAMLMMGRYRGYRLSELIRFKDLIRRTR